MLHLESYVQDFLIFILALYMDIPLTPIHASGPAIFMLYQW